MTQNDPPDDFPKLLPPQTLNGFDLVPSVAVALDAHDLWLLMFAARKEWKRAKAELQGIKAYAAGKPDATRCCLPTSICNAPLEDIKKSVDHWLSLTAHHEDLYRRLFAAYQLVKHSFEADPPYLNGENLDSTDD